MVRPHFRPMSRPIPRSVRHVARATLAATSAACHHVPMGIAKRLLVLGVAGAVLALSACAAPAGSGFPPVKANADELQGARVGLAVGQLLSIDTGDLAVVSYTGVVADPAVARFIAGRDESGTLYNPGIEGLSVGTTTVVLSNTDGGIEDVTFTVHVSH